MVNDDEDNDEREDEIWIFSFVYSILILNFLFISNWNISRDVFYLPWFAGVSQSGENFVGVFKRGHLAYLIFFPGSKLIQNVKISQLVSTSD